MGNIQFQCPVELDHHGPFACVAKCPSDKGYEVRNVNGTLQCLYKSAPENYVTLKSLPPLSRPSQPGTPVPPASVDSLKESNPQLYGTYATELDRFNKEFAVVDANVGKQQKIQDAFKALQNAENARDVSPQAYEDARIRYYTLTKGDTWLQEERERVAKAEVNPVVNQYASQYVDMQSRDTQQRRTIDVVDGVKDKLLSVQDELQTSVNAFSRQINGLKNMINIERRKAMQEKTNTYAWIGTLLNILLVIALIVAIVSIVRTIMNRSKSVSAYTVPN